MDIFIVMNSECDSQLLRSVDLEDHLTTYRVPSSCTVPYEYRRLYPVYQYMYRTVLHTGLHVVGIWAKCDESTTDRLIKSRPLGPDGPDFKQSQKMQPRSRELGSGLW